MTLEDFERLTPYQQALLEELRKIRQALEDLKGDE